MVCQLGKCPMPLSSPQASQLKRENYDQTSSKIIEASLTALP